MTISLVPLHWFLYCSKPFILSIVSLEMLNSENYAPHYINCLDKIWQRSGCRGIFRWQVCYKRIQSVHRQIGTIHYETIVWKHSDKVFRDFSISTCLQVLIKITSDCNEFTLNEVDFMALTGLLGKNWCHLENERMKMMVRSLRMVFDVKQDRVSVLFRALTLRHKSTFIWSTLDVSLTLMSSD